MPSFVVYIDESGDEGFGFSKGSSKWFALSAIITRKHIDIDTVKLVDKVRERLGRTKRKILHFYRLKHEHRLPFVEEISHARLRVVTVLVHKPSLKSPEIFREGHRLYHYATRYLLERVSWCCRDHYNEKLPGDGSAQIVFSHRNMSYDEIRNYLNKLKKRSEYSDIRINWQIIKTDQIKAISHKLSMGLQIADAVASSFYYGVEINQQGFTEPRYASILKPVLYHHRKRYLGNGLKFVPRESSAMIGTNKNLTWIHQIYT